MFSFSAATLFGVTEFLIYLGGLGLLGAWFLAPRLQPWRTASGQPPRWDTPLAETGLLICLVVFAALLGPVATTSLGRALGYAANEIWSTMWSLVGFHGGTLLAVAAFALHSRALPPVHARRGRSFGDDVLLGAAVFCAAMPLVGATALLSVKAAHALGIPVHSQEIAELFARAGSPGLLLLLTSFSVSLVPLNEELLFRAGLFRILRAYTPLWAALLVSGVVFASFHFSAVYFLPLTVLGGLLAYAYEKTGSLVVPVVAHGLFNLNSIIGIISGMSDLP